MAGRNFLSQRIYNWHAFGCQIDAQVSIAGTAGAATLVTSSSNSSIPTSRGIASITRLSTGTYRVQFQDNYSQLLGFEAQYTNPTTGSAINVDSTTAGLTTGTTYQITALGSSTTAANWVTLGLPAGITAAVGMVFKAATTGTGSNSSPAQVKAIGVQAVTATRILGAAPGIDAFLNNQPYVSGSGGYFTFECLGATNSSTTTQVATDPSGGTIMFLKFYLSNSQVG